jgi:TP901 family phage tail tape measure protein
VSNSINFDVKFNIVGDKIQATINNMNAGFIKVDKAVVGINNSFNNTVNSMNGGIKRIAFSSLLDQIDRVTSGLNSMAQPGLQFSSSLADLSAITGVTGKKLDELGAKARASAQEFGGTAAESIESYKVILSRLGPDIAKVPQALSGMEKNVRILSKTMGGDAMAATDALTTSMLQYGVDLSNPITAQKEMTRMMNIMAAGAKEGAAEVPGITQALKVSGVQAKQSKLTFEELNAALQAMAAGGKEGEQAGTGLRNILGKMAGVDIIPKEAADKLKALGVNMNIVSDTSLPFTARLRELKKAQGDATIMAQVFGVENAASANILLDSVDAQDKLRQKITGTNTAFEQAAIVMDSPEQKMKKLQATVDNFKISLFNATGGMMGYLGIFGSMARDFTSLIPIVQGVSSAVMFLTSKEKLQNFWLDVLIAKEAIMKKGKIALAFVTGLFTGAITTQIIAQKAQAFWTGAVSGVTKLLTGAQTALNAAMLANPIGLIIVAIVALIALIVACIKKYEEWGAAILLMMGPIGLVINAIMALKRNWESVKQAFTAGGILGGLKRIGIVLLDAVLYPVQQLLKLLSKIPGMAHLAGKGVDKIADMRKKLNLVDDPAKASGIASAKINAPSKKVSSFNTESEIQAEIQRLEGIKAKKAIGSEGYKYLQKKITDLQKKLNPTTFTPDGLGLGGDPKGGGTGKATATNEAIATGGVKQTTINLNFKNVVESLVVRATDLQNSADQIEQQVGDALLRALGIAVTNVG